MLSNCQVIYIYIYIYIRSIQMNNVAMETDMFHVLFERQVLHFSAGSIHKQQIHLQHTFYASLHPLQTVVSARSIPLYIQVYIYIQCSSKGNRLVLSFHAAVSFSTITCVRNIELYHLILWKRIEMKLTQVHLLKRVGYNK